MRNLINTLCRNKRQSTAKQAKQRLQLLISNDRATGRRPDYLPQLQRDLIDVIAKYVQIDANSVRVEMGNKGDLLELNIILPELK